MCSSDSTLFFSTCYIVLLYYYTIHIIVSRVWQRGLTEPIVIHYPQVMAGTSTMNGDPIFQGATVSLTDIMFGSSHATPPCGELNLLDAALFSRLS